MRGPRKAQRALPRPQQPHPTLRGNRQHQHRQHLPPRLPDHALRNNRRPRQGALRIAHPVVGRADNG